MFFWFTKNIWLIRVIVHESNYTHIVEKRSEEAKVALGISNYRAGHIWSCLTMLTHTHAPKYSHLQFRMLIWHVRTKSTHYLNRASVGARVHWRLHVRVCKRLCAMDPCSCTCVCLCVAGLQDCVEGVCNKCARARGPERYITGGGRAEKVQQGGKGGREKDRLVRKKKRRLLSRGGGGDWFLLGPSMFPIM